MRPFPSLLTLALFTVSVTASAGIAVAPGIIDQKLVAGDNTLEFVVSNRSDHPMRITLSTGSLSLSLYGAATSAKADPQYDVSPLIRFEKQGYTIGPRRWRRIRAHLTAPNRGGGMHGVIFVSGSRADLPPEAQVKVNLQLAVALTLALPGEARPSLQVDELHTSSDGASIRVRNTGNIHVRPEGRLVLSDLAGKQIWSGAILPGAVLPGQERELKVAPLPELPAGQYSAKVELTSPGRSVLVRKLALMDGQMLVSRDPQHSR